MTAPLSEYDVGAVRVLVLDRADVRNALSLELLAALAEALRRVDADDELRVAVLTGADPAFCAGIDLKEAAADPSFFVRAEASNPMALLPTLRTPVVGAINGATFAGGLELALGCDFLIASERAFFGETHARVGVMPGGGLTVRLPQAIGLRRALQMSLTSEILGAERAAEIGLVNEVVPHDELLPRAIVVASAIAEVDPVMARGLKALYVDASHETVARGLEIESERSRAWNFDLSDLAARPDQVMAANRAQREGH